MASDSSLAASLAFPLGWRALGLTPDEAAAFELLLSLWPPGAWHELYDVDNPQSGVAQFFAAHAEAFEQFAAEPARRTRRELDPARTVERLPEWERALGLPATRLPPTTTAGRQAAVLSKLREQGASSRDEMRAILAPLLGYADPATLVILEEPRATLTAMHMYNTGALLNFVGPGAVEFAFPVSDDGVVSSGGVRLDLFNFVADATGYQVDLLAPDGATATWQGAGAPLTGNPLTLRARSLAGAQILGDWRLRFTVGAGVQVVVIGADLFVEGARLDSAGLDGRGAQVFWWVAYADPALEGATAPPDREATRRAARRCQPAHARSAIVTTLDALPGAILPSEFLPQL